MTAIARVLLSGVCVIACAVVAGGPWAATPVLAQMPDLRQMSGMPLPSGDLPDGTVSVRVVRDSLANNQVGVTVQLTGAGVSQSAETDPDGRAIFSGLVPGAEVRATVTVQGETVASQPFPVPPQGGIRLILALGLGGGASADASGSGAAAAGPAAGAPASSVPAGPGRVVLGAQTRTIVEVIDGALEVFHVFEIANVAEHAVAVPEPIEFALPPDARTVTLLEGSTPQARVFERKLVVAGPFAPGRTMAQVAYRLAYDGPSATVSVPLPLPMIQTNLIVRKLGDTRVVAPVLAQSREAQAEGRTYWTGTGAGLNAGDVLTVALEGLPYHARWPRYTALAAAGLVVLTGLWLALMAPVNPARRIADLEARKHALLDEVRRLGDAQEHEARRAALLDELDGLYALLDAERERDVRGVPAEADPRS